ncbi:hypothetical protein BC830DRAFT_1135207 [Chytriomyces sp. MP71]|nr:hypothetical protein BC830DRAFT_1135207 [Chytriomyces sp. MP71]
MRYARGFLFTISLLESFANVTPSTSQNGNKVTGQTSSNPCGRAPNTPGTRRKRSTTRRTTMFPRNPRARKRRVRRVTKTMRTRLEKRRRAPRKCRIRSKTKNRRIRGTLRWLLIG